jgi:hypothetical protein
MKIIIKILIVLFFFQNSLAQKINYLEIRDSLKGTSCANYDSSSIFQERERLQLFDTNRIDSNIYLYYSDIGMNYYKSYLVFKDSLNLELAIKNFKKSLFHRPENSIVLWNLSFSYFFLSNCELSQKSIKRYKKTTPRKYWDKKQMKYLRKICK